MLAKVNGALPLASNFNSTYKSEAFSHIGWGPQCCIAPLKDFLNSFPSRAAPSGTIGLEQTTPQTNPINCNDNAGQFWLATQLCSNKTSEHDKLCGAEP